MTSRFIRCLSLVAALGIVNASIASGDTQNDTPDLPPPTVIDDFTDIADWQPVAADGVGVKLTLDTSPKGRGQSLRIDYDFSHGSGFCIARKELALDLPPNYRLSFTIRGEGPPNNLECKLVSPSGDDVWWVNKRAFDWPGEWERVRYKRRHFDFAWGPAGEDTPLEGISAIEFAIASAEGGTGTVWIDDLVLEAIEVDRPYTGTPTARAWVGKHEADAVKVEVGENGAVNWSLAQTAHESILEIDFGQRREFSALLFNWKDVEGKESFRVELSEDGTTWHSERSMPLNHQGMHPFYYGEVEAHFLRLTVPILSQDKAILQSFEVLTLDDAPDINGFIQNMAIRRSRSIYPAPFSGEQSYWTVVGVPNDEAEALLSEHGLIELRKSGPLIEPFLILTHIKEPPPEYGVRSDFASLIWWDSLKSTQHIQQDTPSISSTRWEHKRFNLEITPVAVGRQGSSALVTRYRFTNVSDTYLHIDMTLHIRPLQVLPPWQSLNITGGFSPINTLTIEPEMVTINGDLRLRSLTPTDHGSGPAVGSAPAASSARDAKSLDGKASRSLSDKQGFLAARFDYPVRLDPGEHTDIILLSEFNPGAINNLIESTKIKDPSAFFDRVLADETNRWNSLVNRFDLTLPGSGEAYVQTLRAVTGHILVNKDGPAIQPGSRTYERSWIRDGAITGAALAGVGRATDLRKFIDWYAKNQYESGKVPCVVDHRGPDPVDEHDSTGQLIYAIWRCYRMGGGDRAWLRKKFWQVRQGVKYIESLTAQRSTDEYAGTMFEGMVPESISHEGYSAKPMHAYWDGFWVLRGLKDAAAIATELEEPEHAERFAKLADDYRDAMYRSMRMSMDEHGLDTIPGCAELGDFDATSTATGIIPGGELGRIPEPMLTNTFERYWRFFQDRKHDRIEWDAYTAYEMRIAGAFVMMGQPARAHEMLDWFIAEQRPVGWRQWPEVSYRETHAPRFMGDSPHTWVGAGFINSLLTMLAYEDESNDSLVIGAGLRDDWISEDDGVVVGGLPTIYGPLSYRCWREGEGVVFELDSLRDLPPGGIIVAVPGDWGTVTVNDEPHSIEDGRVLIETTNAQIELIP